MLLPASPALIGEKARREPLINLIIDLGIILIGNATL